MKQFLILLSFTILLLNCRPSENATNDKATSDSTSESIAIEAEEELDISAPILEPVNQSEINEELSATLKEILKAVENKNVSKLLTYFSKDVKVSFEGENGTEDLKKHWALNKNANKSEIWQTLKNAIAIGGTFQDDNNYWTPYVFTTFPSQYDVYEYAAIVGKAVSMRNQPSLKGEVMAELDYEIVKLTNSEGEKEEIIDGEKHYWYEVIRQDNQKGYIYGKYLRRPVDYRIGMTYTSGRWLIDTFVAGDKLAIK
jgi:hypothetical protein